MIKSDRAKKRYFYQSNYILTTTNLPSIEIMARQCNEAKYNEVMHKYFAKEFSIKEQKTGIVLHAC